MSVKFKCDSCLRDIPIGTSPMDCIGVQAILDMSGRITVMMDSSSFGEGFPTSIVAPGLRLEACSQPCKDDIMRCYGPAIERATQEMNEWLEKNRAAIVAEKILTALEKMAEDNPSEDSVDSLFASMKKGKIPNA